MNVSANQDLLATECTAVWITVKGAHLIRTVIEESAFVYLDSLLTATVVLSTCMYLR